MVIGLPVVEEIVKRYFGDSFLQVVNEHLAVEEKLVGMFALTILR